MRLRQTTLLCASIHSTSAVMMHNRRCFIESEAFSETTVTVRRENKVLSDHLTPTQRQFWLVSITHTPESCSRETPVVSPATTDTIKTGLLYLVLRLRQYTQSAVKFTLTQKSPPISFSWRAIKPGRPGQKTTASPQVDLCLPASLVGWRRQKKKKAAMFLFWESSRELRAIAMRSGEISCCKTWWQADQ